MQNLGYLFIGVFTRFRPIHQSEHMLNGTSFGFKRRCYLAISIQSPMPVATNHSHFYGSETSYYDLAKKFDAKLFDASEWVNIFEAAGAKYAIFTAKHHDGYTLWPSKHANDRGFDWNSLEVGPKRDLVGELAEELGQSPIKFGLYYSLHEWYHPKWQNSADRSPYVKDHMLPQMKDLVNRYQPDIFYPDGDWWMSSIGYRSEEFLTWLYNDSKVASTVLVNDRWGKSTRSKHGGYFTSEYEMGGQFDKPWEEVRGMGFSFGYNRAESSEDYNSPQTLILLLADIVSRGGNLSLNIGPSPDGKIPPIMENHLREMGKWLERNGESIYGTRKWRRPVQWGEGERDYKEHFKKIYSRYVGADYIFTQTINVPDGYARKEAFFTQNSGDLYVILPRWRNEFMLKDFQTTPEMKATLLATGKPVRITQKGSDLHLDLPSEDLENFQPEDFYAVVVKIDGGAE